MKDPEFIECRYCIGRPGSTAYCHSCSKNREAISLLLGVLEAAEKIEGPRAHIHPELRPDVEKLYRAIRKAKGMS